MPQLPLQQDARQALTELSNALGHPYTDLPRVSAVAVLMTHGGLEMMLTRDDVLTKLHRTIKRTIPASSETVVGLVTNLANSFFKKLLDAGGGCDPLTGCNPAKTYQIPSDLMSYIAFPHEGKVYTEPTAAEAENPTIPAVFTFVGQFIDHDLTFNPLNLTDLDNQQDGLPDFASPRIDLDSVYGPRSTPADPQPNGAAVFNGDRFNLNKLDPNAYDLFRADDGAAIIFDPRNDENQLILQIHILLMRVHNKLVADFGHTREEARAEVVANWQSVLLYDYLPRTLDAATYAALFNALHDGDFSTFKHQPEGDGSVKMPHEFAIGFRFGHSQLRSMYRINDFAPIQLFNNRDLNRQGDLRGGVPLRRDHVIDWDVFLPVVEGSAPLSLKIDSQLTHTVFDLPESAVPDQIKFIGNLAHRNLIRSRTINVASGEDLAAFYGVALLDPFEIEPDDKAHYLFKSDLNRAVPSVVRHGMGFKTPLWYYLLKEAEVRGHGEHLGPLGSRLVGEVIVGGMGFPGPFQFSFTRDSLITGSNVVHLRDLIDWVDERKPA